MKYLKLLACAFAMATVLATASSPAQAGWKYQGSDKSNSSDENYRALICDQEADSRTAYVKYRAGNGDYGRINDQDGSSGSCWENSSRVPSAIQKHQTCEDINNKPDACSEYHAHF